MQVNNVTKQKLGFSLSEICKCKDKTGSDTDQVYSVSFRLREFYDGNHMFEHRERERGREGLPGPAGHCTTE